MREVVGGCGKNISSNYSESETLFYHSSLKAAQIVTYETFSPGFSLIQQLKIVLEQYPDDGQILKVRQRLLKYSLAPSWYMKYYSTYQSCLLPKRLNCETFGSRPLSCLDDVSPRTRLFKRYIALLTG